MVSTWVDISFPVLKDVRPLKEESVMDYQERSALLNPLRYLAAVLIAIGGSMHAVGLFKVISESLVFPCWFWAVYLIAIPGYLISAVLILKNRMLGYCFAAIGPFTGGLLIFFGFLFPDSQLLILIPGTLTTEITLTGFITLTTEPVAACSAVFLIVHKIWDRG